MNKMKHFVCTVFWLPFFFISKAQQHDTAGDITPPKEIVQDTIYQKPYESTSDENYHFKKTGSAEKVQIRAIADSDLNKVKSDEDYWYVNQAPAREKKSPQQNKLGGAKSWVNTLSWILVITGFCALLIWFLATSNIRLFTKTPKRMGDTAEEQPTEDIFEMNFEKEIQKAVAEKNFRLAVRLLYLRTLRDLSDKNLISYTHEKTNADYLFQLAGTSYYKSFFRLTRDFEYTWYGQFELSQENFSFIQNDFSSFKQQLS